MSRTATLARVLNLATGIQTFLTWQGTDADLDDITVYLGDTFSRTRPSEWPRTMQQFTDGYLRWAKHSE